MHVSDEVADYWNDYAGEYDAEPDHGLGDPATRAAWRALLERWLPAQSSHVADLACGTGDFCRELDHRGYQAVGFDFSHGMLVNARTTAPLVEADILRLPLADASVDGVTCGFASRNVVSLGDLFTELARVVRPGGRIALLDASRPDNAVMRAGHSVYFSRAIPMIGGLISDRDAYAYLPKSMAYLPAPDEMVRMLADAGFADAARAQLSGGLTQLLTGTRG